MVELMGMGAAVLSFETYHGPKDPHRDHDASNNLYGVQAFWQEFDNDTIPIYACLISTILWFTLAPIVRTFFSGKVLLVDQDVLSAEPFAEVKETLAEQLMQIRVLPRTRCCDEMRM